MKKAKLKKEKKKRYFSAFLSIVFFGICFFTCYFLNTFNKQITPKLVEIATKNVEKLTYSIFNNYNLISQINENSLNNLLSVQKNKNDEIINVRYNIKQAYEITSQVVNRIKTDFENLQKGNINTEYYDENLSKTLDGFILNIPIGVASNAIYLNNLGPKIPVKIRFIGTMLTNLKTRVQNYGINNALIEVYIELSINNEIMTPVTYRNSELNYEILIGSQIINGTVPTYYGGLYETKSNILNVPIN